MEITLAVPADREPVLATLVAAFRADPVLRYLFPDDDTYPAYAAAFFGRLFDRRVRSGSVWTAGGRSVAMWDPPAPAVADAGPAPAELFPADVLARVTAYDDALHGALPEQPFWYLGVLGTHPDWAGRGLGRAVMAEGLRRAARDGVPAVLETSNPGNVGLYRRAGWQVFGQVQAGPLPVWVMRQER